MEKKHKITFFHPYFWDGGVERTNIRLSRYFISKGFEVDFLALTFDSHHLPEVKAAGIHMIKLRGKRTLTSIRGIRQYIKHEKARYKLHIIGCQNYANIILILACMGLSKDMDVIVSERLSLDELTIYSARKKDKLILFLMKKLYKRADTITAISEELANDLSAYLKAPVVCTYNPTYSEDFEQYAADTVDDIWFHENIPVILSAARLEKPKDLSTLLQAFALVRQKQNCRLVIVGDGSERDKLISLIHELNITDDVKLLPFDPNPYKYMARASVFVVSSIYEGLCNTVIEATAVKTPCVVTDCKSGPKEIVLYGKGGLVVPVCNAAKMAMGIEWVLKNPEEAKKKMELAFHSLDRFRPEVVGEKYMNCLKKI